MKWLHELQFIACRGKVHQCSIMDIDNEILIFKVQQNACLYDPKCTEYKNRYAKIESWGNICRYVVGERWDSYNQREKQKIGKAIQKRWKSLKDAYIRSLRAREEKRERGGSSGRPYIYEQQMAFFNRVLQCKVVNMKHEFSSDTEEVSEYIPVETVAIEVETEATAKPVNVTSSLTKQFPSAKRRKTQQDTIEKGLLDIIKNTSTPPAPTVPQHSEEDKMFLLSLLPHIQDMSPVDKLDFKIKIMNLLKANVEMKEREKVVQ